jgi:hypothetical protein
MNFIIYFLKVCFGVRRLSENLKWKTVFTFYLRFNESIDLMHGKSNVNEDLSSVNKFCNLHFLINWESSLFQVNLPPRRIPSGSPHMNSWLLFTFKVFNILFCQIFSFLLVNLVFRSFLHDFGLSPQIQSVAFIRIFGYVFFHGLNCPKISSSVFSVKVSFSFESRSQPRKLLVQYFLYVQYVESKKNFFMVFQML